jgi:hypothetical protein
MLHARHNRAVDVGVESALRGEHFSRDECQRGWAGEELLKCGLQFKDGFKDRFAAEDVQPETGAGQGDGEATEIADVARAQGAG